VEKDRYWVCLVCLVSLVEPDQRNKPNRPDEPNQPTHQYGTILTPPTGKDGAPVDATAKARKV
jgi:hypothetical protein